MKTLGERHTEDGPVFIVELTGEEYGTLYKLKHVVDGGCWEFGLMLEPIGGFSGEFAGTFRLIYEWAAATLHVNELQETLDRFKSILGNEEETPTPSSEECGQNS